MKKNIIKIQVSQCKTAYIMNLPRYIIIYIQFKKNYALNIIHTGGDRGYLGDLAPPPKKRSKDPPKIIENFSKSRGRSDIGLILQFPKSWNFTKYFFSQIVNIIIITTYT